MILDPAYPASRLIAYLRIARPRAWLHIEGAGEMAEELREFLTTLRSLLPTHDSKSKAVFRQRSFEGLFGARSKLTDPGG